MEINFQLAKESIYQNLRNNLFLYFGTIVIFVYLLPYFVFGDSVPVIIHDNLDSVVPMYKILVESNEINATSNSKVGNIMNGLPRVAYPTEWNIIVLLFYLFDPFVAYVINLVLIHFVAYFGMYILLKKHFLKLEDYDIIRVGVALCFALLPFWPFAGLSIAGQPLALYSFLNIKLNKDTKKDWLILGFIPFYSSLIWFIFFLMLMGFIWVYNLISKKANLNFAIGILQMMILYLLIEYRLVYNMLVDNGYRSHREEFFSPGLNLRGSISISRDNFQYGQYHAGSYHQYFIMLVVIVILYVFSTKKFNEEKQLISIVGLLGIISFWIGWYSSIYFEPVKDNITILSTFQWDRFYSLQPLLWYISLALTLKIIHNITYNGKNNLSKLLVTIILILQISFLFFGNAGNPNYIHYYNSDENTITYKEFYSEDLFSQIQRDIGRPQENYRVVSIGLHPSIAQYNGFYTLDGYITNYPLEYKYDFRIIIENELEKDMTLKNYYDNWGSRSYILVSELGLNFLYTKDFDIKLENLDLNTTQLKKMGGEYIFSAVEISNNVDNQLSLLNTYIRSDSIWKIFIYRVD